jgi:hypothetical protein
MKRVHSCIQNAPRFDGQGFELRGKVTVQPRKATIFLSLLTCCEVFDVTWKLQRARVVCAGDKVGLDSYSSADRGLDSSIPVWSQV